MHRTPLAPFWVILTTTVMMAFGSSASAEPAVPTDSSATQSPQQELRRLAEQVSILETLQREIAGDTARTLDMLDTTTQQLQSIHDEVDTPLVSALRTDMAGLREELEQVRGRQHGTVWTALVALAALASLVTAAVALYAVYER